MTCPLPSEFAALVPADPTNPTCAELQNMLLNGNSLIADFANCLFKTNPDGTVGLSDSFVSEICSTSC
jgi:hypothetical protein